MKRWHLLAVFLCAAPAVASAAVFLETSVEEVSRVSDAVVRGRVEKRTSFYSRDRRTILTWVEISVSSAWKGAPGERVRVIVPGGRVGNLAQRVDAAPGFVEGEEVVVFLSRRADFWELNGLALGKFAVRDGQAVPELAAVEMRAKVLGAGERRVEEMALDELQRRVAGADR
jgi:hypothetical protein